MNIIWSPEALEDLEEAIDYLVERSPPAAERLAAGIIALVERLATEPLEGTEATMRARSSPSVAARNIKARSLPRWSSTLYELRGFGANPGGHPVDDVELRAAGRLRRHDARELTFLAFDVDAVEGARVQMDVEIQAVAKAMDEGDGARVKLAGLARGRHLPRP